MNSLQLIEELREYEPEGIVRTLAMMSYNPSIGRVLERDGVKKFTDLMVATVPTLATVNSREDFDSLHGGLCEHMVHSFKTAHDEEPTYRQAQKAINVFFKVYIDWCRQPRSEEATRLVPFLHVPLDSLLMRFIQREFPNEYKTRIASMRAESEEQLTRRLQELNPGKRIPRGIGRSVFGDEFSLKAISAPIYRAWQGLLRDLYAERPVLLDTIWVLERGKADSAALEE